MLGDVARDQPPDDHHCRRLLCRAASRACRGLQFSARIRHAQCRLTLQELQERAAHSRNLWLAKRLSWSFRGRPHGLNFRPLFHKTAASKRARSLRLVSSRPGRLFIDIRILWDLIFKENLGIDADEHGGEKVRFRFL